jgi:hypothetical protein
MSTSDDETFASPAMSCVEKPIKSSEVDSKADQVFVMLIEQVKSERCLYDKKEKLYMNNVHKAGIWSKIAEKVGIEGWIFSPLCEINFDDI